MSSKNQGIGNQGYFGPDGFSPNVKLFENASPGSFLVAECIIWTNQLGPEGK